MTDDAHTSSRPPGLRIALAVVVIVLMIMVGAAVEVLFLGRQAAPVQIYLVIIFFSFAAAIATFLLFRSSTAQIEGKHAGVQFTMTGPLAAFLIVALVLWGIAPGPETHNVQVILNHQGQQVQDTFAITPTIPGVDIGRKESNDYRVLLVLPSYITSIPALVLQCPGYRLNDKPPFNINNDLLALNVVKTDSIPPAKPGELPSPSIFKELPSRDAVVDYVPKVPPAECEFQYRNMTDHNLRLIILDCSRYYRLLDNGNTHQEAWLDFPFDPSDSFEGYDHLDETTGWYCFAVLDEHRTAVPLSPSPEMNLCEKKLTKLTVRSATQGQYDATWE